MATEARPAKQTKVLVVEDDVMIRVVLADIDDDIENVAKQQWAERSC